MTLQLGSRSVHCGAKKCLGDVAILLLENSIGCGIVLSLLNSEWLEKISLICLSGEPIQYCHLLPIT